MIAPKRASMSASAASTAAASATSSRMPVPRRSSAARAAAIFAAPSSVVAVPTTVAPAAASARAIARADAARRAGHQRDLSGERASVMACLLGAGRSAGERRARRVDIRAVGRAHSPLRLRSMRLFMPVSTRPGPHSTTCVTPRAAKRLDRLDPAHRARRLPRERGADRVGFRMLRDVDVVQHGNRRRRDQRRVASLAARRSAAGCISEL